VIVFSPAGSVHSPTSPSSRAQPKRAGDLPVSPLREAESARGVKGPVETDRTPDGHVHVRARHRGALAIEVASRSRSSPPASRVTVRPCNGYGFAFVGHELEALVAKRRELLGSS